MFLTHWRYAGGASLRDTLETLPKKKKWIKFFQQAGEAGLEKLYLYISGKFPSSVDLRRAGL